MAESGNKPYETKGVILMFNLKKIGSLALAGCMAASSLAMSAGAVDISSDVSENPAETDSANIQPRGRLTVTKYISSNTSVEILNDSNWWPLDDTVEVKWTASKGPTSLDIRIEQKVGNEWRWAGNGTLTVGGSAITAHLDHAGSAVRIWAYKNAGNNGDCTFDINLTH